MMWRLFTTVNNNDEFRYIKIVIEEGNIYE